jgi:hypothetical protein
MPTIKNLCKLAGHGLLLMGLIILGTSTPAIALDFGSHGQSDFCTSLDARSQRVDAQLATTQDQIHQAWQQQNDRFRVMTSQQQDDNKSLFSVVDSQRASNLKKLNLYATTSQRTAIATYRHILSQATASRRSAVRQANDSFTAAVQRLVADRQASQAGQVEALRITLDDDFQTASAQCASGIPPETAAHDFASSLQSSRRTFLQQRQADSAITTQVAYLTGIRRQSVTSADQAYSTTMAVARQTLATELK